MTQFSRRDFMVAAVAAVATGRQTLEWLHSLRASVPGAHLPAEAIAALQDPVLERRLKSLEIINRVYGVSTDRWSNRVTPVDRNWDEWQKRTGELPPDFATMTPNAFLPDPLVVTTASGTSRITSRQQWVRRRTEIAADVEKYILGKPYPTPDHVRGVVLETAADGDTTRTRVRVEFGPEYKATLRLEILTPAGKGPFPLFLTNHLRSRPWVNTAVRRGYMACIYRAIDPDYGVSDDTRAWVQLYPDHERSVLGRWAWAASRAIDYLVTLPSVDKDRIATGGHSRNAKQALFAAAFDERIGAVAPSRGNNGSEIAWRHSSTPYVSESLAEFFKSLADWYSPRLRFFAGQEQYLPVDQNLVLAMVAPRGLILSHAFHEHQGNAFGIEQAYRSARTVYKLLGKEENIALYQMPGEHPSTVEDVETYFDFFDTVFGRKQFPHLERFVHGYTYETWQKLANDRVNAKAFPERTVGDFLVTDGSEIRDRSTWDNRKTVIRKQLDWLHGEQPPGIPYPSGVPTGSTTSNGWVDDLYERPIRGLNGFALPFGDDLLANFYLPKGYTTGNSGRAALLASKWPLVIWLHPYSYATGYSRYPTMWNYLLEIGIGVLSFDQIGFGNRNGQTLEFYRRYPRWSLLSKMITDVRAAITQAQSLPFVDRIYLLGYSLGGKLAIHTAAVDERVAGVAAVASFTPLRADVPSKGTEGVRHYSHLHGLLPRLGAFVGAERRIPVDYDEILALIAPRPTVLVAPTLDRFANVEDVRQAVSATRRVYSLLGAENALELHTPEAFSDFKGDVAKPAFDWLDRITSPRAPAPQPAPTTRPPGDK